jgi:hypothetical protein
MRVAAGRNRAAARNEAMLKGEKGCVVEKTRGGMERPFVVG